MFSLFIAFEGVVSEKFNGFLAVEWPLYKFFFSLEDSFLAKTKTKAGSSSSGFPACDKWPCTFIPHTKIPLAMQTILNQNLEMYKLILFNSVCTPVMET